MQDDRNIDQRHRAAPLLRAAMVCAAGLWLAACASTSLNAQWSDPQFAGKTLRGAKVLVACEAADATLQRVCADRMAAQLRSLGALPMPATVGDAVDTPGLLQAARASGASAVMRTSLAPATSVATPGPSIGIGIGGFGGSYRGGGSVGFGVSAPVGGASVQTGYGASASLMDVASGQLMWSANATAPPSSDFNAQMGSLATTLLDSARQTGLFAS
jgi:hypothetical protein